MLSRNHVKMSFMENVAMSHFALDESEANISRRPASNVWLTYVFGTSDLVCRMWEGIGKWIK